MGHEVVAGLLRQEGLLLLCRRSVRRRWYPGVWDLPGGHVEPGEGPGRALARELKEELGIVVAAPARAADASLAGADLTLDIWLIDEWTGTPRNAQPEEHDALGWFGLDELAQLELAHRDYRRLFAQLAFS